MNAPVDLKAKRVVFVQVGDYAAATRRFEAGEGETFFAQRYSVDFVSRLAQRAEQVVQVCIAKDLPQERLPNGVIQCGLNYLAHRRPPNRALCELVMRHRPTHLLINSPLTPVIRVARKAGVDVLPLLADSFRAPGLRARLRYRWLAHNLSHPKVRWVSNRNLRASEDLERIGVPASKIVPFDWPPVVKPSDFEPKSGPANADAPRLLYVGQVRYEKGVGDLVDALAKLQAKGTAASLTIIGAGDIDRFQAEVLDKGVRAVTFRGRVNHDEVMRSMNDHDVVLVPSHHDYPEGMPNVIYEGLCSRTPLIVSDHPMFGTRVKHGQDCLVFAAGQSDAIVAAIERLVGDEALYRALSHNAAAACENYLIGAPWGEVIEHWLGGTAADDAWLRERTLSSPRLRTA